MLIHSFQRIVPYFFSVNHNHYVYKISFTSFCILITFIITSLAQGRQGGGGAGPAVTIAAITQNLKKFDGYFNFYYDDKTGKVYLEIDKFDTRIR